MTVSASGAAVETATAQALQPAAPEPISVIVQTPLGSVVGGSLQGDVLIVSLQALALLRARAFVRAFVARGLDAVRRTISLLSGDQLVLEFGIYSVR